MYLRRDLRYYRLCRLILMFGVEGSPAPKPGERPPDACFLIDGSGDGFAKMQELDAQCSGLDVVFLSCSGMLRFQGMRIMIQMYIGYV